MMTPLASEAMSVGTAPAATTSPAAAGSFVSWSVSQGSAMAATPLPVPEIIVAASRARNGSRSRRSAGAVSKRPSVRVVAYLISKTAGAFPPPSTNGVKVSVNGPVPTGISYAMLKLRVSPALMGCGVLKMKAGSLVWAAA